MARTAGSRNQQYDVRRSALIGLARARLVQPGGSRASLRELAQACAVSLPTLRHYFPRREDLILAAMAEDLSDGASHLAHMAQPQGPFAGSVREAIGYAAFGFDHGVGEIHTLGLTEGLRHATLGPAFVALVLEPSLDALRRRLDAHVAAAEMRATDTKHAALTLLAPVVLAMLHQRELGGSASHPLRIEAFLDDHAEGFARAFATAEDQRVS